MTLKRGTTCRVLANQGSEAKNNSKQLSYHQYSNKFPSRTCTAFNLGIDSYGSSIFTSLDVGTAMPLTGERLLYSWIEASLRVLG